MQAPFRPHPRANTFHGPKRQLLGNQAGHAPPAWRAGNMVEGSKIIISRLPTDVGETEVEDLFKKTVGPLKEVFIIYNSQGHSKGMAVVTFQRPTDAAVARQKYDGKIVDGRRPIKVEIVTDGVPQAARPPPQSTPSLLNRLGGIVNNQPPTVARPQAGPPTHAPTQPRSRQATKPAPHLANVPRKARQKKGPKRVKKSVAQLDAEMDDYRSAAAAFAA
ncbi:hypothetical protein PLICRDRAFT_42096 [Plicaturopsis crispa FD-325 SS-3]|nr:hypothetical protein PLICRDRAFT_42096 [Plicaturopsis crispa FD-325 SS-3]